MRLSRRRLFTLLAAAVAAGTGGYGARAAPSRYYDGPISDHFDGVRFLDSDGVPPRGIRDLIRWWSSGRRSEWPLSYPSPFSDRPPPGGSGSRLRVAFIGHASALIQAGGLNVLVDPVWSERVSPVTFAGPRRVNNPGIAFEALPEIGAVLVSHCHYDHLDLATLSRLAATHRPRVITPLGNDAIMRRHDEAIRAEPYDWGDRVDLGALAVTLMPMRHWSARHPFDRNKALWAAFSIETPAGRIYHVGDSGYGDGRRFREAREHGSIRLAILPIGAYEPRWFMREQHMDPEESIKAFLDLGAALALAHHHGTFQLTDEAIDAPERALIEARSAAGIAPERFRVLKPGEAWELS